MSVVQPSPDAANEATIDTLRRIKAAEAEWEERLATARRGAETQLKLLADECAATVAAARAEAEAERARALEQARRDADLEAAGIVAEGERQAAEAREGTGKGVVERRREVLGVVLGPFAP